ncbi:MAG: hypothetical protein JNL11_19330 [Bdellovibrionaceae bacterium]|nr:hypothetical protein [Pseudobdellovibrionaceae bacterium]
MPQAELIAGFDASAPLGNKPANWAYLEDVLVKEKKLTSIKDSSELQRILRQLNGASQMYSSICVRDSYADLKKSLSLSQATKLCKGMQEEAAAIFKCYLHAERSKCENPPENTSNSELRSLYNKLQDGKHCREVFEGQGVSFPDPEKVLRLIFFKNVKNNFSNNAKDQITYFNELIEKIGAPENLKWTDIDKMSRADIIDKLNAINQFLTSSVKESGPFFPEIVSLNIGYNVFQSMLADLNVDFPWVEPDLHDNSTIDLEFQKFTSEDMVSRREVYEFNRAEGAVYQELEKSIEATEWGKSLSQIEQDLKKQFELFYFNPHDEDAYTAYRNRTSELQKQRVKLLKENLPKSNITYDKIIERLKVEPYPNSEAKKIFDDKLESISKKDPTAFLIEYYGKQDLLSQKGGFGFGMGIGASAR